MIALPAYILSAAHPGKAVMRDCALNDLAGAALSTRNQKFFEDGSLNLCLQDSLRKQA
jgi:hypothetical protein